jgi:hypothetical protein
MYERARGSNGKHWNETAVNALKTAKMRAARTARARRKGKLAQRRRTSSMTRRMVPTVPRRNPSSVRAVPPGCYDPRFHAGQYLSPAQLAQPFLVIPLDDENCLIRVPRFLPPAALRAHLAASARVQREQGPLCHGHPKPRYEMCYTPDGKPYVYSRRKHPTVKYPPHVLDLVPRMLAATRRYAPATPYTRLSTGVDIEYGADLVRGGSISEHADDEMAWGMVAVLSFGQCRYFRIRRKSPREVLYNVPTMDNSLIIMYGPTFQARYTHEVPKLPPRGAVPQSRLSINMRFLAKEA